MWKLQHSEIQNNYMSEEKQEGQKTVVSFIVGLLIGGLLVWTFSTPAEQTKNTDKKVNDTDVSEEATEQNKVDEETIPKETTEVTKTEAPVAKPVLPVGDGKISVKDQAARSSVDLTSATYPVPEGWVGVREYNDGKLGSLLGVVRFSEEQGLVPDKIVLQRSTTPGKEYAVVVYAENGDREFNLAKDTQIDSVFATFTAK